MCAKAQSTTSFFTFILATAARGISTMQIQQLFTDTTVWQLHPSKPLTAESGTPLSQALELLQKRKVGCITIVKDHKVVGVFTERDLINRVIGQLDSYDVPIDSVMSKDPLTIHRNAPAGEAIAMINSGNFRHLPVVDDSGKLVGLFGIRTILNYLAELFPEQVLNLPPDPSSVALSQEGG